MLLHIIFSTAISAAAAYSLHRLIDRVDGFSRLTNAVIGARNAWVLAAALVAPLFSTLLERSVLQEGVIGSAYSWSLIWGVVALIYGSYCFLFKRPAIRAASDVVEDAAMLRKLAKPFSPMDYIKISKGIFVGLNGRRQPVYLPQQTITKNHLEILGESGVGKSSIAGVLLSQLAAAGECVVIFDPKADRNLPGALARAGREWGNYDFHILDLRPCADFPQVNPFRGARADQVEELLQVALELGKTGEAGVDFYRGKDREATSFIAEALADGRTDMLEILECARNDERVTEQENLWRELRQIGRVKAFHTEDGLDLASVLEKPGVLYIIGSTTRLEVVSAQKLILQRILQILEDRKDQSKPVALFLDELKYILSPAALRAAGTVRDRNCHLLFAHQSLGDLDDCPGLNPKAVRGAIWGNCGVKIAYKMLDSGTAQELSRIAGQTAAMDESSSTRNGETSVNLSSKGVDYMPPHVFTHLPKPQNGEASVGVVFGLGTAWYLSTRYIETGPTPTPVPAAPVVVASSPDHPPATPDIDEMSLDDLVK